MSRTAPRDFASRHIGSSTAQTDHMLRTIGVSDLGELMRRAVPDSIRADHLADSALPTPIGEREALAELRELAGRNTVRRSLIGQGYYGTITPQVIARNVLENPSWYTSYTPYQAEISQGRLEALLTFQTMVADLTGTVTANASMLDEATAAAEGMLLARRAAKRAPARFLVDADVFAQTLAVMRGRAEAVGIELVVADLSDPAALSTQLEKGAFGALVQYPAASGRILDPSPLIDAVHAAGGQAVVAADLLALTLLTAPGELGADVVVGSAQRFGVPMGFGGPHAGFMGVRTGLERQLPGRLVGVSTDADGNPAYRLALQTREQHIRRERATSNICTAQVLLAVMAAFYAVYHGPEGLRAIGERVHDLTSELAARLRDGGVAIEHAQFFDTIRLSVPHRARAIAESLGAAGFLVQVTDEDTVTLSLDETVTELEVERIGGAILAAVPERAAGDVGTVGKGGAAHGAALGAAGAASGEAEVPASLSRTSAYLTHPVFSTYHSETAMMRYLKRLADEDYALDRGMIPLGSCTMKLNAATEMEAITWPEFADLHPFAPLEDASGYLALIRQLESWLADLTGYDTVSLQPNAGSQGEYAGLLAIRAYHLSRGDDQRTVCLVPASAHGTNAASAVLAGLRIVVVASDVKGNIDLDDLRAKIAEHGRELAALMITYPSTHGVYEERVKDICALVHEAGGQVYIDGANLNALLGQARPGDFGGDVSHLNLHKTFCIPHGGGGPGVGPVAAKRHLAPFLPGHPLAQHAKHFLAGSPDGVEHGGAPVAAAPYGSPSILPISWAFVRMMGGEGLRLASAQAVLAANYVSARLAGTFDTLYTGDSGLVAHECILDLRPFTARTGITVDDVAKRLIDYGFHAPTMSFPVAGTLMVEPTESEDLAELDRFCDAMIAIAAEAEKVLAGEWPADDNPLVGAPHTAECIAVGEWTHPYSREEAVYPGVHATHDQPESHVTARTRITGKYWPPVRRIDNAYGDRHLACSCPPVEAFG